MTRTLIVLALLFASSVAFALPEKALDDSQARQMLRFLRAVAEGSDANAMVDSLLAMKGTALLIAQQNVSRRVSSEQYREVLLATAEHREPHLWSSETGPRAVKGVEGLLQDVFPSLKWGSEHLDLLDERMASVAKLDVGPAARKLALDNLPEPTDIDVPLFLVMGGRAGAAANDKGIYFDVLATSYRDPQHYPDPRQTIEYFAHELHHVGLGRILEHEQSHLHLNESGQCAFDLLRGLVMEGSASYLINGHRDLAFMRKSPMFAAAGDDSSRFTVVQRVLTGVLQQGWTRQQYEQTATQFEGNTLHITGATILDTIMRAQGRSAVMEVLRDPRQLLIRYNRSVRPQGGNFYFSAALARQLATLGK